MDESGNKGLNPTGGESTILVSAAVIIETRASLEECRSAIINLHKLHGGKEFHFKGDPPFRRTAILDAIARLPVMYCATFCDRKAIDLRRFRKAEDLYNGLAGHLIERVAPLLVGSALWFDTLGGKKADQAFAKFIKARAGRCREGKPRIKDCRPTQSDKEPLGELADDVCGAVSRSLRDDRDNREAYRRIIRRIEFDVTEWKNNEG